MIALLVVAGMGTIGASCHHSTFAQRPEETINRIKDAVNRAYARDLQIGLPEWLAEENREHDFHCLMVAPLSVNNFERSINDATILERGVERIIENLRFTINDLIEEMPSQENITEETRMERERTLRSIKEAQLILAQNTSVGNEHTIGLDLDFSNSQEPSGDIIESLRAQIDDIKNQIKEMQYQKNITEEMRGNLERSLKSIEHAHLTLVQSSTSMVD